MSRRSKWGILMDTRSIPPDLVYRLRLLDPQQHPPTMLNLHRRRHCQRPFSFSFAGSALEASRRQKTPPPLTLAGMESCFTTKCAIYPAFLKLRLDERMVRLQSRSFMDLPDVSVYSIAAGLVIPQPQARIWLRPAVFFGRSRLAFRSVWVPQCHLTFCTWRKSE